ncbi:hypothetical protein ACLMAJ_22170 [Nocardia sp. KC 131]|uniref:hypothetical protein n=1 Tax=Nocardia arseniciresistens TaxID=3392119 RepID=UPI00398EB943
MERKNSWQLADAAGVVKPDGLQHFLNRVAGAGIIEHQPHWATGSKTNDDSPTPRLE